MASEMAEVTFVAWGVEYEYACGRLGDVRKAGKLVIPGALKNRWPHATHMSLDVRGIWCKDPGENTERETGKGTFSIFVNFSTHETPNLLI